jgi:hypothetical protein
MKQLKVILALSTLVIADGGATLGAAPAASVLL